MEHYQLIQLLSKITTTLFIFAFGACVGSLINVLVYRLPRGLDVVRPTSRCPICQHKLSWRENIPILGWFILRGRCRFCKSPISPQYPLVEFITALTFAAFFVLWYYIPENTVLLGIDWGAIRPAWTLNDAYDTFPRHTWPQLILLLLLLGSLIAMTLVDAATFTIPLQIPWFLTAAAFIIHPVHAYFTALANKGLTWRITEVGWFWSIPTYSWSATGIALGGAVGLLISLLLLKLRLIRRSFADYDEWERDAIAALPEDQRPLDPDAQPDPAADDAPSTLPPASAPAFRVTILILLLVPALAFAFAPLASTVGQLRWVGPLAALILGPLVAALITRLTTPKPHAEPDQHRDAASFWIEYPHARREMFKELVFLAPPALLAYLGGFIFSNPELFPPDNPPPLPITVLAGSILGYLIGGAVVWFVRILGSILFKKEAMGLGDVHLMAAVGAAIGWIDATLAFFLAAFVGIYGVIFANVLSGGLKRAMPYGPYLAAATILVLLAKPLIVLGLNHLIAQPPGVPPITLP